MYIGVADAALSAKLKAAARRHGGRVVERRVDSQLLVVDDVAAAGQKAVWAAVLMGTTVASPQRLLTNGQAGPYIAYRPAVSIRRWIWMSDEFKARHPAISQIVAEAAASHRSLWRLIATRVDFVKKSTEYATVQYVMGIVPTRDMTRAENKLRNNVYDMAGFLHFHLHVTGRCLAVSGM